MNHYTENPSKKEAQILQAVTGLKGAIFEDVYEDGQQTHIVIRMERRTHLCPVCGMPTDSVHDYREQLVRDAPAFGLQTVIHLKKRRYACRSCGRRFAETVPFLPRYQRTTNRLWSYCLHRLRRTVPMKDVAQESGLSQTTVARIADTLSYRRTSLPQAVSIDEFKGNSGGHKYQCILTDPKKKQVLDVLPSRRQDELCRYFGQFKGRSQVRYVVMDLSSLFRETARSCFPKAEIVADSFHVVQQATRAMENVRKRIQKDFARSRRKYFKRSRKLLLMHKEQLSPGQLEQVSLMLSLSKDLAAAYYLLNQLYGVMASKDVYEAGKRLSDWFMAVNVAGIEEFMECARTYANWMEEILNIFRTGLSNGYTEGCNNRIKVIKRNAYGMRNFERFRKRILHCMSS